jgi:hypothetical protein
MSKDKKNPGTETVHEDDDCLDTFLRLEEEYQALVEKDKAAGIVHPSMDVDKILREARYETAKKYDAKDSGEES